MVDERLPRCEKTGKVRFSHASEARRVRRGMWDSDAIHPYRCRYCGDIHLGHSDRKRTRRIRRAK